MAEMTEPSERIVGISVSHDDARRLAGVEWMRRGDARRICGLGKDVLDLWVANEIVEAHKLHPGKNGTVIFSAEDIRNAIRASPRYVPNHKNA